MQQSHLKNRPLRKLRAFGLMEVILGMFVLTAGLTVVMAPALQSVRDTTDSRKAVLAANLAQEGVEMVRNIRDSQFAQTAPGKSNITHAFINGMNMNVHDHEYCTIDFTDANLNGSVCKKLKTNTALHTGLILTGNFYKKMTSSGTPMFRRLIHVEQVSDAPRYDVTVVVTWGSNINDVTTYIDNTANCTRGNHCVFSQATFTDWNYWGI